MTKSAYLEKIFELKNSGKMDDETYYYFWENCEDIWDFDEEPEEQQEEEGR